MLLAEKEIKIYLLEDDEEEYDEGGGDEDLEDEDLEDEDLEDGLEVEEEDRGEGDDYGLEGDEEEGE